MSWHGTVSYEMSATSHLHLVEAQIGAARGKRLDDTADGWHFGWRMRARTRIPRLGCLVAVRLAATLHHPLACCRLFSISRLIFCAADVAIPVHWQTFLRVHYALGPRRVDGVKLCVYVDHQLVEVQPKARLISCACKQVHQHALSAADGAPQVHAGQSIRTFTSRRLSELLQHVHRCKLRCVLLQAAQPHDITVWSQGTNDSY